MNVADYAEMLEDNRSFRTTVWGRDLLSSKTMILILLRSHTGMVSKEPGKGSGAAASKPRPEYLKRSVHARQCTDV